MGATGARNDTLPTRWQGLLFEAKAWAFRLRRMAGDLRHGPRRHAPTAALAEAPVLAESVSPLWPRDEASPQLVAGKIHNLRRALRGLHGIVVPAGDLMGFWRQVGRATRLRGYARGRELREGCLIPSIGGGLCHLSNAIYDTALRAGLEVVERHRHSRVVPGSLAEHDRDAVVFWNYRDLRLRAAFAWRLEAWLDAERLHVRIRADARSDAPAWPLAPAARSSRAMPGEPRHEDPFALSVAQRSRRASAGPSTSALRAYAQDERNTQGPLPSGDCSDCGQIDCHRHAPEWQAGLGCTWLVDEDWPEFAAHRRAACAPGDRIVGLHAGMRMRVAGLLARVLRRWRLWRGDPLPRARLHAQRLLARALAARLGARDVRLVVPQGVLPYLWEAGELQGRRFDVCMSAMPMREIQHRLDQAAHLHPHSPTLCDFRVDAALMQAEDAALAQAERWISPHAGILALAGARGHALAWRMPDAAQATPAAGAIPRVFLAASSLARKGAIELRAALRGLPLQLGLPPGACEAPGFWDGIDVVPAPSMAQGIAEADVVVLPAWVEHQPRGLLLALASGKPVIATAECGLPREPAWQCIEAGDVDALRAAILRALPMR